MHMPPGSISTCKFIENMLMSSGDHLHKMSHVELHKTWQLCIS